MAVPRVFVSSTCYDLADERDGLSEFCGSFGFETTLSERGDVFYHPDLHTHVSCVRETSNCHLFVLIIGGRFGGKYKVDPTKSITNAEYTSAIQSGTPVFAFVKQDVLNDHNVWQKNKDKTFAKEIHYPSIEIQAHAEEIFKFIDVVRLAPVNNGLFGFRLTKDIYDILRKQWAALMFDYLQNRTISKQISITNDALGNLTVVSGKIEELVKNIYRNVDAANASTAIQDIDNQSLAEEFLALMSTKVRDKKFIAEHNWDDANGNFPANWWDFMVDFSYCEIKTEKLSNGTEVRNLVYIGDSVVQQLSEPLAKDEKINLELLQSGYEKFLSLNSNVRNRLASKFFWTKKDSQRAEAARLMRQQQEGLARPNS